MTPQKAGSQVAGSAFYLCARRGGFHRTPFGLQRHALVHRGQNLGRRKTCPSLIEMHDMLASRRLGPQPVQIESRVHDQFSSTVASISTVAPPGSEATPMAARAWCPALPKTDAIKSDAPFATFG